MPFADRTTRWVVYAAPVYQQTGGMHGVCKQEVWDAMNRAQPGFYTLVQEGITSEGEAEQLVRGPSGDLPKSKREPVLPGPHTHTRSSCSGRKCSRNNSPSNST
jgi:hypothetical protein